MEFVELVILLIAVLLIWFKPEHEKLAWRLTICRLAHGCTHVRRSRVDEHSRRPQPLTFGDLQMVDYSKPITDGDIKKAKTWYDIVCWGGLLIVLLPVGIANLILGYLMGDSPCTLCWGQREQMPSSASWHFSWCDMVSSQSILATMLVMAAVGLLVILPPSWRPCRS